MSVTIWKNIGETPWDAVQRYRKENLISDQVKICYTGRLDPMAQGILPLLVGEECKKMSTYLSVDKTYLAEAVLGIETDTYDAMGLISKSCNISKDDAIKFGKEIEALTGRTFEQKFPPYSAYMLRYAGTKQPLWWWAMNNRLNEIPPEIYPKKLVTVYQTKLIDYYEKPISEYVQQVTNEISLIRKDIDFRQDKIIANWKELASTNPDWTLPTLVFSAEVSTGTYIRSLVHETMHSLPSHAHLITRSEYKSPEK